MPKPSSGAATVCSSPIRLVDEDHAPESARQVKAALAKDGRPGQRKLAFDRVQVHPPRISALGRHALGLGKGLPANASLDYVAHVAIARIVEAAIDPYRTLDIGSPILMAEGAAGQDYRPFVCVEKRVEHEILGIDLDLVVVAVVAVWIENLC